MKLETGSTKTLLGAILCAVLLVQSAEAKPPRNNPRPPQNQPQSEGSSTQPPAQSAPSAPPAALVQVDRLLLEYKTSDARSAIDPLAGQADQDATVARSLGRVLEQEKRYPDAIARLKKATELAPDDAASQVFLGEALLRAKRNGEADTAFRRAAELAQARGGDALYYQGIAQQRLRQYDAAVETLERVRSQDSSNPLVPFQIGVTRAFQEQWTPAVEQLSRALEMNSGLAYAYYYRGLSYAKLNRKDLLVNDLERFLTLAPNAPEADQARVVLQTARR